MNEYAGKYIYSQVLRGSTAPPAGGGQGGAWSKGARSLDRASVFFYSAPFGARKPPFGAVLMFYSVRHFVMRLLGRITGAIL